MSGRPFVSVVIPCRNEEAFIADCLASAVHGDYPKDRLEVLVCDGMSTDRTRDIVAAAAAADPAIVLVENPGRTAPAAMNAGIRRAKGEIIVRLDAHSRYPSTYISKLVEWLLKSGADNVGGVWLTRPANGSAKARAIAAGLSHPFGVGNAHYRIGVGAPRWVDTVPFGCYRREVFDRIGLFDEDLVRNQDDELNARLIRQGGRILLVPEIVCEYVARGSLSTLWRTYYQYGYFKPLVAVKVGAVMTARQLAPAAFVAALAGGLLLAPVVRPVRLATAALAVGYGAATVLCAVRAGASNGPASVLWLCLVFPVLHVAYGLGFLKGLLDFVVRRRRPDARLRAMAPSR